MLSCSVQGPERLLEVATFRPKKPVPVHGLPVSPASRGAAAAAEPFVGFGSPVHVVLQSMPCPVLKSRYVPSVALVMCGQSCCGGRATSAKRNVSLSGFGLVAWTVWQPFTSCIMVEGE